MIEVIRRIKDPRWIVVFNHSILVAFGIWTSCVQRRWEQILFAFLVGYSLDIVIGKLRRLSWKQIADQFISTTVIVLGLLIFLLSRHWWFYGMATFVAIVAKTLILRPSGQHAYNPTGFAIISMVAMFPHHVFVRGDQYNGFLFPYLFVLFNGTIATIRVDRWRQTLTYITSSFLTTLVIAALFSNHEFLRLFGPDFGVEGLLFMLLMFTDPRTSPSSHRMQILAGVAIGILNVSFRSLEFAYSQFLAIFVVSSFIAPWYDSLDTWRPMVSPNLSKALSRIGATLIVLVLPLSWIFRVESWPFTDYRMFSEKRSTQDASALHLYLDEQRLLLPSKYHGYHFLLDFMIRDGRLAYAKKLLLHLYKRHLDNGGQKGSTIVVKRTRPNESDVIIFSMGVASAR